MLKKLNGSKVTVSDFNWSRTISLILRPFSLCIDKCKWYVVPHGSKGLRDKGPKPVRGGAKDNLGPNSPVSTLNILSCTLCSLALTIRLDFPCCCFLSWIMCMFLTSVYRRPSHFPACGLMSLRTCVKCGRFQHDLVHIPPRLAPAPA